jgi:hypothetical protein
MRGFASVGLVLLTLGYAASPVAAGPMLSLSSPNGLSNLSVGDVVRIDVTLSGLDVGNDFIFVLNSRLLFPGSLFDPVPDPVGTSGLTPGPILQTAGQRASFHAVSSLSDGVVVGRFSDLFPTPSQVISQNGLYYSFLLRAEAVGSGAISFDASGNEYASVTTGFNLATLPTGGPLPFTVGPGATAVPAPPALVLVLTGLILIGGREVSRRRRGP